MDEKGAAKPSDSIVSAPPKPAACLLWVLPVHRTGRWLCAAGAKAPFLLEATAKIGPESFFAVVLSPAFSGIS